MTQLSDPTPTALSLGTRPTMAHGPLECADRCRWHSQYRELEFRNNAAKCRIAPAVVRSWTPKAIGEHGDIRHVLFMKHSPA